MLTRLPEFIDPLHLADTRGEIKGEIPIGNLARLSEMLINDSGSITVHFVFGREGKLAKVEGRIQSTLNLQCQNCLEAVEWPIDCEIKLGIVNTIEQADRLPEEYEPLMTEEEKVPLNNIIEDEILLNLPAFPKHEHQCVTPEINNKLNGKMVAEETSAPKNPFAILAKLKKTGDS